MDRKKIEGKISILPKLALTRPVTVLMSLTALLVVGYIAYKAIAVELMPAGFTPPFLGVWTPYPNANPEEVEQLIARPIEEVVRTIKGVKNVNTYSQSNGCWTFLRFNQNTDMDLAYSQLRDRIDRVRPDLPDDVERLYIRKWNNDDEPIMWIALIPDKEIEDPYYFTENMIKKPLERVDGVANVEIWGADEKSIQIQIRQDAVKSYKINLFEIIQKLRSDNFAISSGDVRDGNHKIYVRSIGKFRTLDEIRHIPIRGTNIFLKDIADVVYDVPERSWVQRIDGKSAIQLGVFKESMANTVALCDAVKDMFENDFKKDPRLSGFKVEVLFNQGDFINESIDNLTYAGIWGGLFAFLVLYFFLRRFRMTLMLNLAIPLSILFSLTVLYFMDWTLNLITMMGLMISIGMVVDNSIVVLENIYRKRAEGEDNLHAAAKGTSEVSLAVTMATFTTIVVFLPLILMNDDAGFRFFMLRIGVPVMISLVASLFVAMVFIPLAATRIVSKREVKEPEVITKLNNSYGRILGWSLRHRLETFIALLLLFISLNYAKNNVAQTDNMDGNINDFRLFLELPDNYTLEDAGRVVGMIEDSIKAKADRYNLRTIDSRYRHNNARLNVFLHPEPPLSWYDVIINYAAKTVGLADTTHMVREAVVEDVKKRIPELPGVKVRTSWRRSGDSDEASISISLYGDDTRKLASLSEEVERRLKSIPEIISVDTDRENGEDEIQLNIKREQAQKYGINPRTISGTVMYALRGIQLPKFQTEDREIDMLVQLQEEDRQNLQQLKNITFFAQNGKEIPLESVATVSIKKGFGEIQRENGKTFLAVQANTTAENIGMIHQKIDKAMEGFQMPYGYSWSKGNRFRDIQDRNSNQMFGVILSITFVFLLMGILFESFVLPLSVIIAIPFSFVGAYWMLLITGTPFDTMSAIGLIILIGVVVNNAIVLIDLVNRLRQQGYSRLDALLNGGKMRFRPILMTAFTTIGGLIPMALGNAKMIGISYQPLGLTIVGGMMFSTLVSLVAVPWAYMLFDDMRNYFKRVVGGVLLRKIKAKPATDQI
ncbi:MAG: efflux RND transporter permease subunit [Calditrichaeota bacterium]|nr:efflux RND transporter permease subunit [Calditrichota bacterium]